MSDLRTRLERIGDRIDPRPDAFERLERARRRRERNRRVVAGAVAFAVAIAGSLAAFTAFRDSDPRVGGGVEEGFFALWPEATYAEALELQEDIDGGGLSRIAWRLDPIATAAEFARTPLGWGLRHWGINVEVPDGVDVEGPGPITLAVYPTTHGPGDTMVTDVTLARLVRPDGIWSVVGVESDVFDLRIEPGEQVALGDGVAIPTTLEEGTEVAVGVAGTGACSGFHEERAEILGGTIVVPVDGVGEGCTGYLYALTPPTPVGQVELGKIMFVYGEPKPALGYTIESIVAVPVRFVAPSDDEPPSVEPAPADAVHITCDGPSITLDLPSVLAEPDGVHVIVGNTTDHSLSLVVLRGGEGPARAVQVEPGDTHVALQLPPGPTAFYCADEGGDLAVETDRVQVEVRDDRNLFVPFDLACGGTTMQLAPTFAVLPGVELPDALDPLDLVRDFAEGLQPSDVIERAGYPAAEANPVVRVVRGGQIVAMFDVFQGSDGWTAEPAACAGSGISIPPGPDPYPRGAFEWCPEPPFSEPGRDWSERASEVALRFVDAYGFSDMEALAQVLDPSVPPDTEFPVYIAEGSGPNSWPPAVLGTSAAGGELVRLACGPDVDAYTVSVAIDDGTDSASLDYTVYLVFRDDGWKVWAVY